MLSMLPPASLTETMLPRSSAWSQRRSVVPVPSYQTTGSSTPSPGA